MTASGVKEKIIIPVDKPVIIPIMAGLTVSRERYSSTNMIKNVTGINDINPIMWMIFDIQRKDNPCNVVHIMPPIHASAKQRIWRYFVLTKS